jgi:hypothetical protein
MKSLIVLLLMTSAAIAGEWSSYYNDRFGATIDVPPGFLNDVDPPDNGDGLTFNSSDKLTTLLVWGNNILSDFATENSEVVGYEKADGWDVTYQAADRKNWSVYSGHKGDVIMYRRGLASCKGTQMVQFRIEYPVQQKQEYDRIVARLTKSLRASGAVYCR